MIGDKSVWLDQVLVEVTASAPGGTYGAALGVVVDGVPAGLRLDTNRIQEFMDRRKPGQSKFTTARKEADAIEILSGVFEGKTTGTPISMMVRNADQHSKDYSNTAEIFRPGHADYTFYEKYGIRDYRGGGRSSGRETIGRVAAGAIAIQILEELGVEMCAYTKAIGPVAIASFDADEIRKNPLAMPDAEAAKKAQAYLEDCIGRQDSAGGVIECRVKGMPAGVGEPVFDKLDAFGEGNAIHRSVKGFEIEMVLRLQQTMDLSITMLFVCRMGLFKRRPIMQAACSVA